MPYLEYPRHLHGPNGTFVVVHNDTERDLQLAKGWYLWPTDVPVKAVDPSPETTPAVIDEDAPPSTLDALTVAQASELVAICDDVARLQAWQLAEAQGKGRKGLLAVLEDRLTALAEA